MLIPDAEACFLVPWYDEPTAQIIHDAVYPDGRDTNQLRRDLALKRVIEKFTEKGLKPIIAPELEFFLVAQSSDLMPLKTPPGRSGRRNRKTSLWY